MDKFLVIKMLSDETRFKIFTKLLDYDRLCVSEIEGLLGIKQANTSKHLKKLRENGIVESTRESNTMYYNVRKDFMKENEVLVRYLLL
ncbi:Cadmium resistance transcriptional regulatory protein CadC [Candidatus Izimaplasma bacterium HR1]|nr:Cadmium resistance transcriptional regulatory protein CadC [Candidatus Izimaplasma bacterium HR1]